MYVDKNSTLLKNVLIFIANAGSFFFISNNRMRIVNYEEVTKITIDLIRLVQKQNWN